MDTISGKLSLKRSKSQETQKKSESSGQSLPNCCDSFENMFKNDDAISDDVFVTKNEVDGDENNDWYLKTINFFVLILQLVYKLNFSW